MGPRVQYFRGDRVGDGWDEVRGRIVSRVNGCQEFGQKPMKASHMPPDTHKENLVSLHRDAFLTLKNTREPEQTTSVARRTLWEHNEGTMYLLPDFLQTLVFLLIVGGLDWDPSGVAKH